MYNKIRNIHMVGIGGIGMSGIAILLVRHGYRVSGSDLSRSESVRQLEQLGIQTFQGHSSMNAEGAELVVHSSAIKEDNPEIQYARERNIPVIPRADMLAELMRLKYGVAVAGAHGKTTTTSMISSVLLSGDLDPTIVVGGRMDDFGGTNARLGSSDFMVVEADESDGSFNKLSPSIAIVTNLDREHIDHYKTMAAVKKAFLEFLNKVPFYGLCIVCGDDPYLQSLLPKVTRRKVTYGFKPHNDYQIREYLPGEDLTRCRIALRSREKTLCLKVPGKHNALNALAALAVGEELSIPTEKSLLALQKFHGVQRRLQKRGLTKGVTLLDDYAHHPTEIMATLSALRERFPKAKIRVVFQPHRYTRVEDLFYEFSTCFRDCDAIGITPIYAASEKPIAGIDSESLTEKIVEKGHGRAKYFSSPLEAMQQWISESVPGDIVVTLGAGDLPHVYSRITL